MKSPWTIVMLTGLVLQTLGAVSAEPRELHYRFTAGTTNVYRLEIESQGESGKEAITGVVVVACREATPNQGKLAFKFQLRPKATGGPPMYGGYRPGGPVPLMAMLSSYPMENRELILDPQGRVLKVVGDQALPVPMGTLMTSLFPELPAGATAGWKREQRSFVMDDPILMGPVTAYVGGPGSPYVPSYGSGRNQLAVLGVSVRDEYQVKEGNPECVNLEHTQTLESELKTGNEPRVSCTSTGVIVLERATAWPRRLEMQHKVGVITEYLSRRMVVSMKWQELEGEERATALQPPPPPRATTEPLAPAEVAKLLMRLQAEETYERENAARELSNARIANPAPEFMAEMIKLSTDRNETVRQAAVTMVAKYGTREQVPLLIKALKDPANSPVRSTIAKGLGRLKDPRAAEPLAEMLSMGATENYGFRSGRDNFWVEALVELGPSAEGAVLPLFKEKNIETRILACAVLKEVGSKKTMEVLKDQTGSPSKELSEAAAEAIRAIQARADK